MGDVGVRRGRFGPLGAKIREWIRRYLPLEVAGWIGELGSAALAYRLTGSLAAAAVVATVGSSVGYYLPAYVTALRWSLSEGRPGSRWAALAAANLRTVRSLVVEFGPAECVDSLLVRPFLYYATPVLLGHVVWGWVLGGLAADLVFYVITIFSYERLGRWLVHRPAPQPVPPVVAASTT